MAGFIVSIGSKSTVENIVLNGYFTPYTSSSLESTAGKISTYSTLADICSMQENDNIYFLKERKIYGVGRLINLQGSCYYNNYINALDIDDNGEVLSALSGENNKQARWIFFFEPSPCFFSYGVDMDDVLQYKPISFRMLRAFQDRSFIKIDDEENDALKQFIYLRNQNNKSSIKFSNLFHTQIQNMRLSEYKIDMNQLFSSKYDNDTKSVNLESILEAFLVNHIIKNGLFNIKWDYVSHQVIASPFKPLAYIDKMDIFAYKFLDYPHETKPIEKYLVIELKKENANQETIEQAMKYVDWVCKEYAAGDYSLIKSAVIASKFTSGSFDDIENKITRTFIKSTHPIKTECWKDLKCFTYNYKDKFYLSECNYYEPKVYIKSKLKFFGILFDNNPIVFKNEKYKPVLKIKGENKIAVFDRDEVNYIPPDFSYKIYFIDSMISKEDIDNIIYEIKKRVI